MDDAPQVDSDGPKKLVQGGFYLAIAAAGIILIAALEITDDYPNYDRIASISTIVVLLLGFGTLAISMGLMTYGLENRGEFPMVRVAAILAATYLFNEFLNSYNPMNMLVGILEIF